MSHQKIIISRSFLNSGTLIVIIKERAEELDKADRLLGSYITQLDTEAARKSNYLGSQLAVGCQRVSQVYFDNKIAGNLN